MDIYTKQGWKARGIELGYILGLSLILAAIIYFFASNWPGFDKWMKITLSIGLILLFYIVSFMLRIITQRHPVLHQLFLFFGCLAFGVGVALLGQIYNSHADSYMLFIIWLIPALLFSFYTKFQPFYLLSYVLIHLTIFFYLFPSSGFTAFQDVTLQWIFLSIALLNGVLFMIIERNWIKSIPIQFVSFIVFHVIMLALTMEDLIDPFNVFVSLLYLGLLYYFYKMVIKKQLHKSYFIVLGLASIAFVFIKFIEFVVYINSEYIFLLTIFVPFIIIGFVIYFLRRWSIRLRVEENTLLMKLIIGVTTGIASIIAGSSLFGIGFLFIDDIPFTFFAFFSMALIFFASRKQNWNSIITYTILFTALFIGIPATIFETGLIIDTLFIMGLLYVFWSFKERTLRYLTYLSMMMVLTGTLFDINTVTSEAVLTCLLILNLGAYLIALKIPQNHVQQIVMHNSMFYGLLAFFVLTFLFEEQVILYYSVNVLYFASTTFLVIWSYKRQHKIRHRIFLAYWFLYIVYKYYDLVWSLLHKSITFFLTGLLILLVMQRIDRKTNYYSCAVPKKLKRIAISVIIIVQLLLLGVQIGKGEAMLASGELIKLELAPVDPRSLFQGDYLILRYSITSIPIEDGDWNKRVRVGLVENENGVYEYSGNYVVGKEIPDDMYEKADVWITGIYKGYDNIEYGIENYFVQEGTGFELQAKVNFAYVRVADNGDSMLVELTAK